MKDISRVCKAVCDHKGPTNDIEYAFHTISNLVGATPWYVYLIFFYLVRTGIQMMKDRDQWIPRLFIVPAFLIFMKLRLFHMGSAPMITAYVVVVMGGLIFGYVRAYKIDVSASEKKRHLYMSGSMEPFALFMIVFGVEYAFGYLEAKNPNAFARFQFFEVAVSGLASGYFLGCAFAFVQAYARLRREKNG